MKKWIARATEAIFYKERINYTKVLQDLSNIVGRELELRSLITKLTSSLTEQMKLRGGTILVSTERGSLSPIHAPNINHTEATVQLADPFVTYLKKESETIVLEELDRKVADAQNPRERHQLEKVRDSMERIKAEAAVPVFLNRRLNSILLLDRKLSGDVFNQDDIDLFEVLAPQLASSIQKAQLYEKSLQFGERLKMEVKKATEDLRVANTKLKELDQAKSEFMSIASHQLRTPLTGLIGYLSMLSEGDYGKMTTNQTKVIHELLDAAQRLVRMVNLFLNVTRIEAGRFLLNIAKTTFEAIATDAVRELQPTAEKKKITLEYHAPAAAFPPIYVDIDKVKDVFLNFIDNAIKYTPKGSVTVRLHDDRKRGVVRAEVTDTGVGIEPKEAQRLFDKFVRGREIARIAPNGSGLGLFIAKKIVDAHEGRIWVESAGEGKGSTFYFEIPTKVRKTVIGATPAK